MENIQKNIKEAHQIATDHGFHEEKKCPEHWLMLAICEISEAVEADRNNKIGLAAKKEFEKQVDTHPDFNERYNAYVKGTVAEELTDTYIRLCDMCGEYNITPAPSQNLAIYKDWKDNFGDRSFTFCAYTLVKFLTMPGIPPSQMTSMVLTFIECWARSMNIDLKWHIETKMQYNKNRIRLHGKSY